MRAGDAVSSFGFDDPDERWIGELAGALAPDEIGAIGPYEILDEVARGGQGVVFRARQVGTQRELALKRLIEGRSADATARRRFEREVEAAARLRHPGIVTVLGMEEVDGVPLLAMSWIDGEPLDAWARAISGRERWTRVLACFLRVCEAVEHAHRHGVLHLDLKPSNVLVDGDDQPVVLDFGLARFATAGGDHRASQTGAFAGTLAYASPEQLAGQRASLDARSDVYSLGVLLYEVVTGALPFAFANAPGPALEAQAAEHFPRMAQAAPELPRLVARELDAILARALAALRSSRYPTSAALSEDVRRLLDGRPVLAHPPSAFYEIRKLARRHRAVVALLAVILLAGIAYAVDVERRNRLLEVERAAEAAARQRESEARADAQAAGERAVAEATARGDLLDYLFDDLFAGPLPRNPDATLTVVELLEAAAAGAEERFAGRPAVEAELRLRLGNLFGRVGQLDPSIDQLRLAAAAAPEGSPMSGEIGARLGTVLVGIGRFDEAEREIARALGGPLADEPRCDALTAYATLTSVAGRRDEADAHALEALELARTLGDEYRTIEALRVRGLMQAMGGGYAEARATYAEALERAVASSGPRGDQAVTIAGYLGDLDQVAGYPEDAERNARMALDGLLNHYGERHPRAVAALGDVGEVVSERGRLDEADELLRRAVAGSEELRGPESLITAIHRTRLLRNALRRGEVEESVAELEHAHAQFRAARGEAFTWTRIARDSLMAAYGVLERDEAVSPLLEAAMAARPRDGREALLVSSLRLQAEILHARGERDAAWRLLERALADSAAIEIRSKRVARAEARRAADFYRGRGDEDLASRIETLAASWPGQ